jgi:hypothetical protein
MDEIQRQALNALFEAKLEERERLDTFLSVLGAELGRDVPSGPSNDASAVNGATRSVDMQALPAASVGEGQYFGMSAPKAAKDLLERFGRDRPMKTQEIFDAITKGGVQIGNASTLYRSLSRDTTFFRLGKRKNGRWGLREWYPASVTERESAEGDEDDDLESGADLHSHAEDQEESGSEDG